jgi:hypothetical protein
LPHNPAIDRDARKRCALPGVRYRGRYAASDGRLIRRTMAAITIEDLTPVIGWLLGLAAATCITAWDHWIAFTLLGLHMIHVGLKPQSE